MRLVDADKLNEWLQESIAQAKTPHVHIIMAAVTNVVDSLPTVDAIPTEPLCDFLASNYEPFYDLDEIQDLRWPIDHEQQKMAWMKFLKNKFAPEKRDQGA